MYCVDMKIFIFSLQHNVIQVYFEYILWGRLKTCSIANMLNTVNNNYLHRQRVLKAKSLTM